MAEKTHLLSQSAQQMRTLIEEMGQPGFRAHQLRNWIFRNLETDFSKMTNMPASLRQRLAESCTCTMLEVKAEQRSVDGTRKWALRTFDGHALECVMIPSDGRRSICVSSQIGCAMGCTFCRTATMGFIRNLTLGEILEQVHFVNRVLAAEADAAEDENRRISNVIFMGMGEPLHNLENVAKACEVLSDPEGFGISKHKITVSTSGIVPQILAWGQRAPEFKLAISLNGSNNTMRSALMPVNRRWPIEALLDAADAYIRLSGQMLTFEYILIKDKTCTLEAARDLKRIASRRNCKINLIPLNKGEDPSLQPPSEEEIAEFESALASGDFQVLRRRPRGPDILAACGQLAQAREKAHDRTKVA